VATQDRDAFEHLHARRRERGEPSAFENLEARRTQLIRTNFEPQLTNLGLSVEQIERQNLDELNQSLNKVNDAISHPENFGTLTLEAGGGVGFFGLNLSEKAHIEIGILPLLLERKSLIFNRINSLAGERKIASLNDLVATVADPELRAKIESELSVIADQSRRVAEQESVVAQAQADQIAKRDQELRRLSAELWERKLRAWTGFFAKESMATYVGAFLLIVLTFVQVAAMFLGATYKSEIISNAFLLLLGYFFGQSVSRTAPQVGGQVDGSR
jgi:hypothetical protein